MSYFQFDALTHFALHKNVNDDSVKSSNLCEKGVRSHIQIILIWLKWEILWCQRRGVVDFIYMSVFFLVFVSIYLHGVLGDLVPTDIYIKC